MSQTHPTRRRRALAAALAAALATTLPSCLAVAAAGAVGYVQYDRNEAHAEADAGLDEAFHAAAGALADQGFPAAEEATDDSTSRALAGDGVRVVVERITEGRVRVRVRVGTFATDDNERRAELLLEDVLARLA